MGLKVMGSERGNNDWLVGRVCGDVWEESWSGKRSGRYESFFWLVSTDRISAFRSKKIFLLDTWLKVMVRQNLLVTMC